MLSLPPPPNPKRPTQASQKRQFKKLVKPFRSPLVNYEDVLAGKNGVYESGRPRQAAASTQQAMTAEATADVQAKSTTTHTPFKDHTANTAKPFRLPVAALSNSASIVVSKGTLASQKARPSVLNAPTIQSLQARVQKLKQAMKIKDEQLNGDDDQRLEALVTKWRTAGREVAWLVWDTVRDLEPSAAAMGAGVLPARGGWDDNETPINPKAKAKTESGTGGLGLPSWMGLRRWQVRVFWKLGMGSEG